MPFDPYLNVEEIESALINLVSSYPSICQLIPLPHLTFEGRTSNAIKIHAGMISSTKGLLFLGGTHAREWGSSDILISFLERIIDAYTNNSSLIFQGKAYTSVEVKRILEYTEIFIFPDVNPDGKAYSQSGHDWRKNRRPVGASVGVDINRNYDFLWDADVYFDPSLYFGYLYSEFSETYHGSAPFSEAESKNVKWIIDTYSNICFCTDLHSFGQKIMYTWSDDENQVVDVEKNFANPSYDGQRGLQSDSYKEFLFETDNTKIQLITQKMRNAIFAVRGKDYSIGQIYNQVGASPGDSASYFFSRHFSDSLKRKIYAYGIEWGTSFQPNPPEMLNIMDDIGAAVTELCLCACEPDFFIRDNLSDHGDEPSTGSLSMSPDIIIRKTVSMNSAIEFGDPSVDPGSDKVEIGNDNYLYIRVHNKGGMDADCNVRVYFAPLTTSCAPSSWTFIDEVIITSVPKGEFKVSDTIIWHNPPDPGTSGHFCIIAICGNLSDPFPDFSMIDSASDFIKFIRNSNNISYRNVVFENAVPDGWIFIPFTMYAFSKHVEQFDLIINGKDLPRNSEVRIKVHNNIIRKINFKSDILLKREKRGVILYKKKNKNFMSTKIGLVKKDKPIITLMLKIPSSFEKRVYQSSIQQIYKNQEVGRINIFLKNS